MSLPSHLTALLAAPQPAPTTENEVFVVIFDYIDRLFSIVRPRRVLFMAIGERAVPGPRWSGRSSAAVGS